MGARKIEPMTVEEIKRWLIEIDGADETHADDHYRCFEVERSLILAWANAEARARYLEQKLRCRDGECAKDEKCSEDFDWLAAVKREIGWPEDS